MTTPSVKILYSMGCKCDPHLTMQKSFPQFTAPSLFAGHALLQEEKESFIPLGLFNGEFEKNFFGMQNWKPIWRVNFSKFTPKTDNIWLDEESGRYFQYRNNLQNRTFDIDHSIFNMPHSIDRKRLCYINNKLSVINFHANDKTPGVNPAYTDYQFAKYEYFLKHKYDLRYLFYTHRATTKSHIASLIEFLEKDGNYDLTNFVFFNRAQFPEIDNNPFVCVNLPDCRAEQAIIPYSAQCLIMKNYVSENIISKITKTV